MTKKKAGTRQPFFMGLYISIVTIVSIVSIVTIF